MPDRYSFSGSTSSKPWFRVGNLDVTTTVFVTALAVLSLVVWAVDRPLLAGLALDANSVRHGQIWRLVTWPLANELTFWTALSVVFFWFIGSQIEVMMTRDRYTVFLLILTVVPGLVATLIGADVYGIGYLQLGLFIVFIAEYPFARFFFNIPGWVLGAIFVGLQVLQLVGFKMWGELVFLAAIIVTAAIGARGYGLASALPWIPKLPMPLAERSSRSSSKTTGKRGRKRDSRSSKSTRGGGSGQVERASNGNVVAGPWTAPPPPGASSDRAATQAELDDLLDKISAEGLDSLSSAEKQRLNELSKRLR